MIKKFHFNTFHKRRLRKIIAARAILATLAKISLYSIETTQIANNTKTERSAKTAFTR